MIDKEAHKLGWGTEKPSEIGHRFERVEKVVDVLFDRELGGIKNFGQIRKMAILIAGLIAGLMGFSALLDYMTNC